LEIRSECENQRLPGDDFMAMRTSRRWLIVAAALVAVVVGGFGWWRFCRRVIDPRFVGQWRHSRAEYEHEVTVLNEDGTSEHWTDFEPPAVMNHWYVQCDRLVIEWTVPVDDMSYWDRLKYMWVTRKVPWKAQPGWTVLECGVDSIHVVDNGAEDIVRRVSVEEAAERRRLRPNLPVRQ
jgi:hypothetical protein